MNSFLPWWSLALVAAFGGVGCGLLARGGRGTVLIAPLIWGVLVWIALSAATLASETLDPALAFVAAASTLLPAMAIFGAKRPQHLGWQWIVVALWATLIWPALEALLLERPLEIASQPLRAWFLVILLAVQWSNWCVTRYFGAVTLATAAQAFLLGPNFPWSGGVAPAWSWTLGFMLAACVPWEILRVSRKRRNQTGQEPRDAWREYDRLWFDFRDGFGVVWALRAMERVNEVARLQHWNVELTWSGFAPPIGADANEGTNYDRANVDRIWNNVLRRFVDDAWIGRRMGRDLGTIDERAENDA